MITTEKALNILKNIVENNLKETTIDEMTECYKVLKDICEENDIHRYEVMATGRITDLQYIKHDDEKDGLIKFLFEKSRKVGPDKYIRGKIAVIMDETKCNTELREGDRVTIWGDFSPYETTRDDGTTFHKMRVWVDKIERVGKGSAIYTPKKEIHKGGER